MANYKISQREFVDYLIYDVRFNGDRNDLIDFLVLNDIESTMNILQGLVFNLSIWELYATNPEVTFKT